MKSRVLMCLVVSLMLTGCISSLGDIQSGAVSGRPSNAQFAQMDYTTPSEIKAVYDENPLDADKKYAGKWTKVRGVIAVAASTEYTDIHGKKGGYSFLLGEEKETNKTKFSSLSCGFPTGKETEDLLRTLKRGQVVEVGGRIVKLPPLSFQPTLTDCIILKIVK